MSRRLKVVVLVLVIVLLISSMSVLLTSCNEGEQEPKDLLPLPGEFYALQEAYNNGIIDKNALLNIAYYNNLAFVDKGNFNWEDLGFPTDFEPTPLTPLDEETIEYIVQTARHMQINAGNEPSDYEIESFYGAYNGAIALQMHREGFWSSQASRQDITIEGITFLYAGVMQDLDPSKLECPIKIWVKNND